MAAKSRKLSFIAGAVFAFTVIVSSLVYTAGSLVKFAWDNRSVIEETIKSALLFPPAQASKPERYIFMGYNKDSQPLQVWRLTELKKSSDGTSTGVIVTEKGKRHPVTAYWTDGMFIVDYRPDNQDDPGFGRFFSERPRKVAARPWDGPL